METMKHTPLIFYFHGFGSTELNEKDKVLIERFGSENVVSLFSTEFSMSQIEDIIFNKLLENNGNPEQEVIFIGTSLGAWLAAKVEHELYPGVKCILINPSYSPQNSLQKYGIVDVSKYHDIYIPKTAVWVFGTEDEVLTYDEFLNSHNIENKIFVKAHHSFNSEEFKTLVDLVI